MALPLRAYPDLFDREDKVEEELVQCSSAGHGLDRTELSVVERFEADAPAWWQPDPAFNEEVEARFAAVSKSWRRSVQDFVRSVQAFNAATARRPLRPVAAQALLPTPPIAAVIEDVTARPKSSSVPSVEAASELARLTRRQREVAVLIARGHTDAQIARELVLTHGTASNHVAHILRRLGCRSRAQVATWAVQNGLVSTDSPSQYR